jgi:hypothetical protein
MLHYPRDGGVEETITETFELSSTELCCGPAEQH